MSSAPLTRKTGRQRLRTIRASRRMPMTESSAPVRSHHWNRLASVIRGKLRAPYQRPACGRASVASGVNPLDGSVRDLAVRLQVLTGGRVRAAATLQRQVPSWRAHPP